MRTGSLGSGDGWFCSEGPGPSVRGICRGTLGSRGRSWASTPSAPSSSARSLGSDRVARRRDASRVPPAAGTRPARAYTSPSLDWDAWADIYYKIYDNEIGYIFHRQFNLAGADLAPAFWLMYNDATKTLSDMPELVAEPDIAELTEELRISFQLILAGRSKGDIELQDKILDDDPRRGRRLEGRALLRAGHGRVHQRVPAAARPQAHQLRLGRRLHRQLDAVRHAGLGQGLRAGRPRPASNATPPAASSSSAAATR